MGKISELETAIKDLHEAARIINSTADVLTELFSSKETDEGVSIEPTLTLEQVRAVLAEKSRQGHTAEVRSLLQKYGAEKLSAVDPSNYKALLNDAEVL